MRPGRPGDLAALRSLWTQEALRRGRDCVPSDALLARMTAAVDWEARSRVIEDAAGARAIVVVMEQPSQEGTLARVETAAREEADRIRLVRWALGLSRAAGARVAQVWRPKGARQGMAALGLTLARPFWRMDRGTLDGVAQVPLPPGYRLAERADRGIAADAFNRAFAEHWRFQPLDVQQAPRPRRPADLELLAVDADGTPAAIVWCEVERYEPDPRPQPVGLVEAVGTVPGHRRRGLASALTAEGLRRLRRHGARSASLYVDGLNPTRAHELYARLGFAVAFQYEVFEARLG